MANFDFGNTCPDIDKALRYWDNEASSVLRGYIDDETELDNAVDELYKVCESVYEDIRSTNVNMREAAQEQLDNLEYEWECKLDDVKSEHEAELDDLKADYEAELDNMQKEVNELQATLDLYLKHQT